SDPYYDPYYDPNYDPYYDPNYDPYGNSVKPGVHTGSGNTGTFNAGGQSPLASGK
ncbi:MAG: hypothetical protein JST42_03775, partial [Bacteroidetes bacterium]|nr:hypothetical protein [Bacteroidota bacterium]